MADTNRLRSALVALLADNTTNDIQEQDLRDWLLSTLLRRVTTYNTETPTISDDDVFVLLDGSNNTVAAALTPAAHRIHFIKAVDVSNAVTLTGANIDGVSGYAFASAGDAILIAGDGTEFHVFAELLNA